MMCKWARWKLDVCFPPKIILYPLSFLDKHLLALKSFSSLHLKMQCNVIGLSLLNLDAKGSQDPRMTRDVILKSWKVLIWASPDQEKVTMRYSLVALYARWMRKCRKLTRLWTEYRMWKTESGIPKYKIPKYRLNIDRKEEVLMHRVQVKVWYLWCQISFEKPSAMQVDQRNRYLDPCASQSQERESILAKTNNQDL